MVECSICLEQLEKNTNMIKLSCDHEFHYNCLIKVENNKCPLCRCDIITNLYEVCECKDNLTTFFYTGRFKKSGKCTICLKYSKLKLLEKYIKVKII